MRLSQGYLKSKENFLPPVVKNIHFAGAAYMQNVGWLQTELGEKDG